MPKAVSVWLPCLGLLFLFTGPALADKPAPPIVASAFAPDGRSVVVASQAGVQVRHWPELSVFRQLDVDLNQIHDLAFSPDGEQLAVGCTGGRLHVIDPNTHDIGADLKAIDGWAYTVSVSPDGGHACVGGTGGQVVAVPLR